MNEKVRKLVTMAMLAALSIVLVYVIHFPIFPAASFLEYDPADIPILIGTFAYGPLAGVLLTVVVSVIQGMTVSSGSGLMGIAMHFRHLHSGAGGGEHLPGEAHQEGSGAGADLRRAGHDGGHGGV